MLSHHIENLQNSILWAQQQDDLDVLCQARDHLTQLMSFVSELPMVDQIQAQQTIEQVLPMEWPLWMEACRYEDGNSTSVTEFTLH
ncbi:hypothetical protein [Oceanicoccus sp. KOV_DT_Chl]|uniref:hypothetical protein n=1 Tax=Oceanicoccus sp. KOV_DT_Chl TaxID=1904639 RepID=UPI000C7B131F|nr:hypothetical protein [Oceanicoccus sp. KOV_DT_Chl]